MAPVRLGPRLRLVADLVHRAKRVSEGDDSGSGASPSGDRARDDAARGVPPVVADVGCELGTLGIALLVEGRAARVIGVDVRGDLVEGARRRAAALLPGDLRARFEARAGEGLGPLSPGEADVIVLAGLGGLTIAGILEAGRPVAERADRWILQPMRAEAELRQRLWQGGADVVREELVHEGGRFYPVIVARPPRRSGTGRAEGRAEASAASCAAQARAVEPPPRGSAARALQATTSPGAARKLEQELARRVDWPDDLPAAWLWEVGPLLWRDRHPLLPAFAAVRSRHLARRSGDPAAARRLVAAITARCGEPGKGSAATARMGWPGGDA